ncbi:BgTH12-02747, partial [Blumeria graminis f. sp. triticale]
QANLPNLRRLFVEARTEAEESAYSRTAFYNIVLFISSVAVFSLIAQHANKANNCLA